MPSGLQEKPDDTHVRLNLAWCLAMQACFEAGREAAQTTFVRAVANGDAAARPYIEEAGHVPAASCCSSRPLLNHSLRQAVTVMQLTINPQERAEVTRLRTLVSVAGGEQAIIEANAWGGHILANLTQAIQNAPDAGRAPRRKRAPRPEGYGKG